MASSGNTATSQLRDLGLVEGVEDAVDVAVEVAHDQVELAGGDTQAGHVPRLPTPDDARPTCCQTAEPP